MKKFAKLLNLTLVTILLFLTVENTNAQTPMFDYGITAGSNIFPLSTTTSNKVQWLYVMSEFNQAVPAGEIYKIYLKRSNTSSNASTFQNLTIKMAMVPNTMTVFPNTTYWTNNMVTVKPASTVVIPGAASNSWFEFELDVPFDYDGTSNIIVEMSQTSYNIGIDLRNVQANTTNRRIYGAVGSTSGSLASGPVDLGLDMIVVPPAICDTVNTPTGWELEASQLVVCSNDQVTLNLSEEIFATGVEYLFQQSTNNGATWTNVAPLGPDDEIEINNIGVNTLFRAIWFCNNDPVDTTNTISIQSVSPEILTTTNDSICGEGNLNLSATGTAGSNIVWYDNPNASGTPVYEGPNFTTPHLTNTTSYWVVSQVGGSASGSGELTTTTAAGNGCSGGAMFNIIPTDDLNIDSFIVNANGSGSDIKIYYKLGTFAGNETNQALWTLHETVNMSYTTGLVNVPLSTPLPLNGGTTYGIYIEYNAKYTNGNLSYSNADMTVETGTGLCSAFGGTNFDRMFNGTIYYSFSGCESSPEEVVAVINPPVEIDMPSQIDVCVEPGYTETLDAGAHPHNVSYLWDDNSTDRYREVDQSGTYTVVVTNEFGCQDEATIQVDIKYSPMVNIGEDTVICEGNIHILDAGPNGESYTWNNGINERYNEISSPGTYIVIVEGANGCITMDTINIEYSDDEVITHDMILVNNLGPKTFNFKILEGENIESYLWHFGDGNMSNQPNPTHTYEEDGYYVVNIDMENICGVVTDSIAVHILSISELDDGKNLLSVYPNPTNGKIIVKNDSEYPMDAISITDATGRTLNKFQTNPQEKFEKSIDLSKYAQGIYLIHIHTQHGIYTKQVNLIK